MDIDIILEHFILERWRQYVNKFRIMDLEGPIKHNDKAKFESFRLFTIYEIKKLNRLVW